MDLIAIVEKYFVFLLSKSALAFGGCYLFSLSVYFFSFVGLSYGLLLSAILEDWMNY